MKPRNLNKKPVLVVDPEELAREHEQLHLVGSQLVDEDEFAPAPPERRATPLGLAPAASEDYGYREDDEQDLPSLEENFDPDALLGLSGHEEAAEDEAAEPARRVGIDLDALRSAAGFDEEGEDDLPTNISDFAAYDLPALSEESAKRIGLDLDALRSAAGFDDEEGEEADGEEVLPGETPDRSAFEADMPTELPEKRVGLDLDALRMAGGFDEEDEDDDLAVNMPDLSAFRAPAPAEDAEPAETGGAADEQDEWTEFADESVGSAPNPPASLSPFHAEQEPEPEPEWAFQPEPTVEPEPEPEPEPLSEQMPEQETAFEQASTPEPGAEHEAEPEPEPVAESPERPEPTLLRLSKWQGEETPELKSVLRPQAAEELPFGAESGAGASDTLQAGEPEQPALDGRPHEPPRPAHCQVRAKLIRQDSRGISKPRGIRGWLRSVWRWLEGY